LSLHAQADAPGDDDARMADAQEMAEAARRAIYKDFVTKYSAPKNQVAQDLLTAYIEALVDALEGEAHGERDIAALKGMFDDALKVVTQIAARALVGADGKPLDSASTGPSPADAQLGLYNDFKKFVLSRAQGGRESEDKAKILYLEAQISELQGYLQSNDAERIRLIDKIQSQFLHESNGEAARTKRKLDWLRKIDDIKKHEAQLNLSRIKLGKARVAEALLRDQVARDKKTAKTAMVQETAANRRKREDAQRKYDDQQERAAEKARIAKERLVAASAGDNIKYRGKHNHAPEAIAAAARPKKRRNVFMDDEAEEAPEEDDEYE